MNPLNYGTHYREWYREALPNLSPLAPRELQQKMMPFALAYHLLSYAEVFMLPEGGRLLTESGVFEAKYAPLTHLPYPVTAFEFPVLRCSRGEKSTKRIALCFTRDGFDWAREFVPLKAGFPEFRWGCISIIYLDKKKHWAVIPAFTLVTDATKVVTEEEIEAAKKAMPDLAIVDPDFGDVESINPGTEVMHFIRVRMPGFDEYPSYALELDTHDELMAAVQACAALNCRNVGAQKVNASAALNKKRLSAGREPYDSYRILTVDVASTTSGTRGGSHASPRAHLRRGHLRRITEDHVVWVQACVVGNHHLGTVTKKYAMKPTNGVAFCE